MEPFRCIAFETSTVRASVAACNGEQVVSLQLEDSHTSSRQIFGAVATVLAEAGLSIEDLQAVAYGCGPGAFTGVRIAASATQGIAFAQDLPVCRVSSLEALAFNAVAASDTGTVAACIDARMGEVFLGVYAAADGDLKMLAADALATPDNYRLAEHYPDALPAGNGWSVYPDMLTGVGAAATECWPDAAAVLNIARQQFARNEVVVPSAALPNYVRDKVTY